MPASVVQLVRTSSIMRVVGTRTLDHTHDIRPYQLNHNITLVPNQWNGIENAIEEKYTPIEESLAGIGRLILQILGVLTVAKIKVNFRAFRNFFELLYIFLKKFNFRKVIWIESLL